MYYRYKTKRNRKKLIRIALVVTGLFTLVFLVYIFREDLMFWKFSYNTLVTKAKVEPQGNPQVKKSRIIAMCKASDEYKEENSMSSDAYFISGKVHFSLGEILLGRSFSWLVIDDSLRCTDPEAIREFTRAIKDIRKGIALKGEDYDVEYLFLLARAMFYLDYYDHEKVYAMISEVNRNKIYKSVDNVRFYAILSIMADHNDEALEMLKQHGDVERNLEGVLFFATAHWMAKSYTTAIMLFKEVLEKAKDQNILKLANINLARIYYHQSLYRESLTHLENALAIDGKDVQARILQGKNYQSLGDKMKAREIWKQVLGDDEDNEEVKKLINAI